MRAGTGPGGALRRAPGGLPGAATLPGRTRGAPRCRRFPGQPLGWRHHRPRRGVLRAGAGPLRRRVRRRPGQRAGRPATAVRPLCRAARLHARGRTGAWRAHGLRLRPQRNGAGVVPDEADRLAAAPKRAGRPAAGRILHVLGRLPKPVAGAGTGPRRAARHAGHAPGAPWRRGARHGGGQRAPLRRRHRHGAAAHGAPLHGAYGGRDGTVWPVAQQPLCRQRVRRHGHGHGRVPVPAGERAAGAHRPHECVGQPQSRHADVPGLAAGAGPRDAGGPDGAAGGRCRPGRRTTRKGGPAARMGLFSPCGTGSPAGTLLRTSGAPARAGRRVVRRRRTPFRDRRTQRAAGQGAVFDAASNADRRRRPPARPAAADRPAGRG